MQNTASQHVASIKPKVASGLVKISTVMRRAFAANDPRMHRGCSGINYDVASVKLFAGQYFDQENGLHYNYFRDYDPSLGRYVQSDPIGLLGGLNTYGYVLQNPLYWIDPLGLSVTCTFSQSTGQLTCTDDTTNQQTVDEQCYSGAPGAVNDGSQQNTPNVGPIPLGDYDIGAGVGHRGTGPNSLPLTPMASNDQFPSTRNPGSFLMHGDNSRGNQSASQGCIICSPNTRSTINNSGGGTVTVQ